MFAASRKRLKIPFQGFKEITILPNTVCGFGNQYELLTDPQKPQVDPIQVGPTG